MKLKLLARIIFFGSTMLLSSILIHTYSSQTLKIEDKGVDNLHDVRSGLRFGNECDSHLELCWMRRIIQEKAVYNLSLSGDIYDFTNLYKYMFLPVLKVLREAHIKNKWKEENPLTISIKKYLNDEYAKKGLSIVKGIGTEKSDYLGRTCILDATKQYKYNATIYYKSEDKSVYISLVEKTHAFKSNLFEKIPNAIYGVISTGNTSDFCMNKHFNEADRTYVIRCPVHGIDFIVALEATYLDISAYEIPCGKLQFNLMHLSSNNLEEKERNQMKRDIRTLGRKEMITCNHENMKNLDSKSPKFWMKIDNQWHWFTEDCYYPYYLTKQQIECISNQSIVMMGDSHAQYRVRDINAAYNFTKLKYGGTSLAMHFVMVLKDWLRNSNQSGQHRVDWLVLNAGHHDQRYMDSVLYIAYMSEVFSVVDRIQRLKHPPKILWVQTTDTENQGNTHRNFNKRLNHAWNDWTEYEMRKRGVGIVPAADIASALPGHTRDRLHHQNYFGKEKVDGGVSVGGATVSVLLGMICQG